MNYIEEIINFKPSCEQEENDKKLILELVNKYGDKLLYRESELFHITSSSLTMNKSLDKVLMVHHNIYNSWSWIGGHADGEGNLLSVAMREIQEESGVSMIKAVQEDAISLDILTTNGHRKKGKYVSSHLHLSVCYLLEGDENEELIVNEDEMKIVKLIFKLYTQEINMSLGKIAKYLMDEFKSEYNIDLA